MVEKSQDIEMDKSVAVGNVENNSEKVFYASNKKHGPETKWFSDKKKLSWPNLGTFPVPIDWKTQS